jgi:alpha/beta superfamily hydrolase
MTRCLLLSCIPATLLLAACAADDDDATADPMADCGTDWSVVQFGTEDGETLEADYRPATTAGAGAVVLLHMIPPGNTRTGYPEPVRNELADTGFAVLNVDRRGAGGSTGVAVEAFEGPGGRLDVEAAVDFLLSPDRNCPVDRDKLVLVGASNGSTSVHDYTVAHRDDLPAPAATAFLSPGGYTANNQALPTDAASRGPELGLPILWVYPTSEDYSTGFIADAHDSWRFVEHGTQHGTRMFDGTQLQTDTVAELVAWIQAVP